MRRLSMPATLGSVLLGLSACATQPSLAPGQRFPVFFTNAAAAPDQAGLDVVAAAADWARRYPGEQVSVTGYADPRAPETEVQRLAHRRADAVAGLLEAKGVAPERIHRAVGDETLIGITGLGNRRVDIAVGM